MWWYAGICYNFYVTSFILVNLHNSIVIFDLAGNILSAISSHHTNTNVANMFSTFLMLSAMDDALAQSQKLLEMIFVWSVFSCELCKNYRSYNALHFTHQQLYHISDRCQVSLVSPSSPVY